MPHKRRCPPAERERERARESDRKRASIAAVMQYLIKKVACRYKLISNKAQLPSRAQNLTLFRQE